MKGTWHIRCIITTTEQDGPIIDPVKCVYTSFNHVEGEQTRYKDRHLPSMSGGIVAKDRHTIQRTIEICCRVRALPLLRDCDE